MPLPLTVVLPSILAETNPWTQWVVVAAIVAGTGLMLFKSKYRPKKDPLSRAPESTSLAQHRSVERQMQSLLVELSEMSRQVTAKLDTRAAKLDALIREADEKIAVLSSLQNGSNIAGMTRAHLTADSPDSLNRIAGFPDQTIQSIPVESGPSPYDSDPRHAQVYLLADQGQSPAEIANQLQRPTGEVQLILALRAK